MYLGNTKITCNNCARFKKKHLHESSFLSLVRHDQEEFNKQLSSILWALKKEHHDEIVENSPVTEKYFTDRVDRYGSFLTPSCLDRQKVLNSAGFKHFRDRIHSESLGDHSKFWLQNQNGNEWKVIPAPEDLAKRRGKRRKKIEGETKQEREKRRKKIEGETNQEREKRRKKIEGETKEEREKVAKERARWREADMKRRKNETKEKREERLAKKREAKRKLRENETKEDREKRLAKQREQQKERRKNETKEKREERLAKQREYNHAKKSRKK